MFLLCCIEELGNAGCHVDYVATHIAPHEAMDYIGDTRCVYWRNNPDLRGISDPMPSFLQFVAERTLFKCWYFGHSHANEPFVIDTAYGKRAYRALYKGLAPSEDEEGGEDNVKASRT